jgi:hypothetical protein
MTDEKIIFADNIRVASTKWGREFLGIILRDAEPEFDINYEVLLYRYCVPGRVDSYCFRFESKKNDVVFTSDTSLPLLKATQMLIKDLDKPQVVELVKQACEKQLYFTRRFILLLEKIAPKSKSLKAAQSIADRKTQEKIERLKKKKPEFAETYAAMHNIAV